MNLCWLASLDAVLKNLNGLAAECSALQVDSSARFPYPLFKILLVLDTKRCTPFR